MKKSYTKLVMLLLAMVGCMTASAQSELVELDETMFKAWDGAGADATELDLSDEDNRTFSDGSTFGCEVGYFKNVDGGNVVYGNGNVIYTWYADLTGTKKMYFYGQKGITIRVLYNRQAPEEGDSDAHGHACPEKQVTIGDDGVAVLDVEELGVEYFHINCLKINWGAQALKFKRVMLEGTVPASGKTYSPLDGMKATFEANVTSLNLGSQTNMYKLLDGKERVMFPVESGTVKLNGTAVPLTSVEGMIVGGNARIFMFMSEDVVDDSEYETADVKLSFNNPADETLQLVFTDGRFEGETLPEITDMVATHEENLGEYYPNVAKIPEVESAVPELGSINLPVNTTEFKVTFTGNVDLTELKAKFDGDDMTVTPSTGIAKEVTLTRPAGDVTTGIHTINISGIMPEQNWFDETGTATLKYSFGLSDLSETVKTYMTDGFEASGNGTVPAAWIVNSDGDERTDVTGLWGGCRLVGANNSFAPVVLYLCSRGNAGNIGHAYYGMNAEKLYLKADTTYHLTFDAGNWDNNTTRGIHVQVVAEEIIDDEGNIIGGGDVIADEQVVVDKKYDGGQYNHADIEFTTVADGNYILKFFPTDANGNAAGWGDAVALANVKVQYVPDVMGIELLQSLSEAMKVANTAKQNAEGERYAGDIYNALDALITKYTATPPTAPSAFDAVAKELTDAATAMDNHRTLCDDFDKLPAQLMANIDKYAESKYNTLPAYTNLVDAFNKYATVEEETVNIDGVDVTKRVAKANNVTDDSELKAGIEDMTAANAQVAMFTDGASQNGTVGYAALHERLRRGVATAEVLGLTDENAAVAAANEELGDNDVVAKKLKAAIKKSLYAKLNENPTVEEPIDMSVYVKNPNLYVTKANANDFSDAMAPGWHIEGASVAGNWGTNGGGGHVATDEIPADEALTISSEVVVTQQITDLPAGVYKVIAYLGERKGNADMVKVEGVEGETDEEKLESARALLFPKEYVFVNTTATEEGQYDNKTQVQSNGVSWGATDNNRIISEEITVTDGKITLGVRNEGAPAWFAFNDISLQLVAAAPGFDYSKLGIKGDVNNDESVTMADANAIVNYYLSTDKDANFPVDTADMNGDGDVTMADANAVVNEFLAQ